MLSKSKNNSEFDHTYLRERMVDEQLRARGIQDETVLSAMRVVPRHLFVPEDLRQNAYDDGPLPIGCDQTISQPYIVASMTEHLVLDHTSRVLEIGTGSGYQAAVLAEIAKEVYTIEIIRPLLESAERLFKTLCYRNIVTRLGDGCLGWPDEAPFDGIIATAAAPRIPQNLIDQLSLNGTLVIPLKGVIPGTQELIRVRKTPNGLIRESLYHVRFVPMRGEIEEPDCY